MPSDLIGIREIPPPPPPRKTTFVYVAFLAGFVMLLAAGALSAHVYLTKRWLTEIKSDAAARALSAGASPVTLVEDANKCPAIRPVLVGFDDRGKSICRPLPAPCNAGQYIASIDPATLELECVDAGAEIACPQNSYVTEFAWLGEGKVSFSCHPRLDPFTAWKFTPVLGSRGNN